MVFPLLVLPVDVVSSWVSYTGVMFVTSVVEIKCCDPVPELNSIENDSQEDGLFSAQLNLMIILIAINIKSILILEKQIEITFY